MWEERPAVNLNYVGRETGSKFELCGMREKPGKRGKSKYGKRDWKQEELCEMREKCGKRDQE